MNPLRYDWMQLEQIATELFTRAGVSEHHARTVAQSLVHADLRGIESHGLSRLPIYMKRIEAGVVRLDQEPELLILCRACHRTRSGVNWGAAQIRGLSRNIP